MTIERHEIIVPPLPHHKRLIYRHTDKSGAASIALLDWIIDNGMRAKCDKTLRALVDARRAERV